MPFPPLNKVRTARTVVSPVVSSLVVVVVSGPSPPSIPDGDGTITGPPVCIPATPPCCRPSASYSHGGSAAFTAARIFAYRAELAAVLLAYVELPA